MGESKDGTKKTEQREVISSNSEYGNRERCETINYDFSNAKSNNSVLAGQSPEDENAIESIRMYTIIDALKEDPVELNKTIGSIISKISALFGQDKNSLSSIDIYESPKSCNNSSDYQETQKIVFSPYILSDANHLINSTHLLRGGSLEYPNHGARSIDGLSTKPSHKFNTVQNTNISSVCNTSSTAVLNYSVDCNSKLIMSAEFLMNSGAEAFCPPNPDYNKALKRWLRAFKTAERTCAPLLKAKIMSNISSSLSTMKMEHDAFALLKAAWSLTLKYISCLPDHCKTYWTEFIRSTLKLDTCDVSNQDSFMCKVDSGSQGGMVSINTISDKEAYGISMIAWIIKLSINVGNRYYKLRMTKIASKYFLLAKFLSEKVIEDVINCGENFRDNKNFLSSSRFHDTKKLSQISPHYSLRTLYRTKVKQLSPIPLKNKLSSKRTSLSSESLSKKYISAGIKLNYILFEALLCNAKSLSSLGVCYSSIPELSNRALAMHLEAENVIMRLLSLISLELNGGSSSVGPPYALIESRFTCFCILLNLSRTYKNEKKIKLAKVYRDLSISTYQNYLKLVMGFYDSKNVPSNEKNNTVV